MITHDLLKRQLRRIGLEENQVPSIEKWKQLLERIDKAYLEFDQERYLHEIAIEVSSRETSDLNQKLERAQKIAHLGYWYFDRETQSIQWSKEMYNLFDCNPLEPIPSFADLINRLNKEDRNHLKNLIKNSWLTGADYEMEAKIINSDNPKYRWIYFSGHPHHEKNGEPIRYLSGIAMDITRRKESEEELYHLNQKLIASARRAGMAEIATSILHNIGNILNSVNISVEVIQKDIQKYDIDNIIIAIQMLLDNLTSLETFLTQDKKGKFLPEYFMEVKKMIEVNSQHLQSEILRLKNSVAHIKDIVSMQNSISGNSQMLENISLSEILETALQHFESTIKKHNIILEKNYEVTDVIKTDKHKVLQILVNLIQNAKDSLIMSDSGLNKKIIISTSLKSDKKSIDIKVTDTGLGILSENLMRIFSFGFTTKSKGHGFGLHSSALLAKELGGSLNVESDGIGRGATFILSLPLVSVSNRSDSYERQV